MVLDALSTYLGITDKGALLAPLAILSSTAIAVTLAIYTTHANKKSARLKNSMDFINSYNESEDINAAIKEVSALSSKSSNHVENMATDASSSEAVHLRKVLNYYESMAICITRNIYDDAIIKDAVFTTVLDMWTIAKPFVIERRKQKNNNTYYQEIELLCAKWQENPLKKKLS